MQSDPVIIPVEVDLTRATTALRGLGDTLQTVRGSAAGGGAVPGVAGAAAGLPVVGSDQLALNTLRSLQRELTALESSVTRLVFGIDKLLAFQQQGTGVAAPAIKEPEREMPEAKEREPAGGGGEARPAREAGGQGSEALAASVREAGSTVRQLMLGALSLGGIGLGVGAAYQQVQQWFQVQERLSTEFGRLTFENATPEFPGGRMYRALENRLTRQPREGLARFISIGDLQAGMETLGGAIGDPGLARRFVTPVGAVGLQAFGQPGPAYGIAAAAYETFRSEKIPELLGTLVRKADEAGVSRAQMLQQFSALRGFYESRQGQFARTGAEVAGIVGYQSMLNKLPGGVGVGQGGVTLAQEMAQFGAPGSGGLQEAIRMRAYTKATGKPAIGTAENYADFIEWSQDPKNDPRVAQEARGVLTPGEFRLQYSRFGAAPIRPVRGLLTGDLRVRPELDTPEQIEQRGREAVRGLEDTPGGMELEDRQELERLIYTDRWARWAFRRRQHMRRWIAHHQHAMLGIELGVTGAGIIERIVKAAGPGLGGIAGGLGAAWWLRPRGGGVPTRPVPEGVPPEGPGGPVPEGGTPVPEGAPGAAAGGAGVLDYLLAIPGLLEMLGFMSLGYLLSTDENGRPLPPGQAPPPIVPWAWKWQTPTTGGPGHQVGPWASGYEFPGQIPSYPVGPQYGVSGGVPGLTGGQLPMLKGGRIDLRSQFFRDIEKQYGIPTGVLSALAKIESGGRPGAIGPGGRAKGLFQFMPGTAAHYGIDPFDPVASTIATAKMLTENFKRLGSWQRAIGAHYGGPGTPWDTPIHGMTPHQYADMVMRKGGALGGMPGLGTTGQPGTEFGGAGDPSSGWLSNVGMAFATGGQVDIYIHMDPSFPGLVTADSSNPNVNVRRQQ